MARLRDTSRIGAPTEPGAEWQTLMHRKAHTFRLASSFLPVSIRNDVRVLYAYFRTVDDLADEPNVDAASRLDAIEHSFSAGESREPLICEVLRIATRYGIPLSVLSEILRGARSDIAHAPFTSLDQLYGYSDLVAGSVGATLSYVLGDPCAEAQHSARKLGIAMQFTNVLRDVGEDLDRGRVYLPLEELSRVGISLDDLGQRRIESGFRTLMASQISRARHLYADGLKGLPYLRPTCRPAVVTAASLYSAILSKIESMDYDVFSARAHLTSREKLLLLPGALGTLTRRSPYQGAEGVPAPPRERLQL